MKKYILSSLARTMKGRNSMRTVVPLSIVKSLDLSTSDMLEWIEKSGEVIVKKHQGKSEE